MKKLLLLALLLMPLRAFATITVVQHKGADFNTSATSNTLAFTSNVTAGDTIFYAVRYGTTGATFTISDNVDTGNYAQDKVQTLATDGDTVIIGSYANAVGGATTLTFASSSATSMMVTIVEVSGLATSSILDQTASANSTSTAPNSGNTATTTVASEFVFSAVGLDGANAETITGAGSTTLLDTVVNSGSGNESFADGYQIVSATGTYAGQYSLTVSEEWAALVATYKTSGGGSSCTHAGYESTGATAVPNGTSGSYWLKGGTFGIPNCSSVDYWQPSTGNFGVN